MISIRDLRWKGDVWNIQGGLSCSGKITGEVAEQPEGACILEVRYQTRDQTFRQRGREDRVLAGQASWRSCAWPSSSRVVSGVGLHRDGEKHHGWSSCGVFANSLLL